MDIEQAIRIAAKEKNVFSSTDILTLTAFNYSRQYVARQLREMVALGYLVKSGSTKNTQYALPDKALWLEQTVSDTLINKSLNEDFILNELHSKIAGFRRLPENIRQLFNYSFSEMMNNAIEHSKSKKIVYQVYNNRQEFGFSILDMGIGVFENIKQKRQLRSEVEAIQDLLKGKTTTAADRHSGEGIFFTSKACDVYLLNSHHTRLRIDNLLPDTFVEELAHELIGTEVVWRVNKKSQKKLADIFRNYQAHDESYLFDKTSVLVKLYTMDTEYISRSQARRLLFGLDAFTHITLDFEHVKTVGQGFADEIFRVFIANNPHISITYIKAGKPVEIMIKHVQESKAAS